MVNDAQNILVTGGTGLLGSHLIFHLLSEGKKVRATYRKSSNRDILRKIFRYYSENPDALFDAIEWVECDLTDYGSLNAAMPDISHVYHCASWINLGNSNCDEVIRNNVTSTSNVVKGCFENKITKLCHVSSVAAVGAKDGNLKADETLRLESNDKYPPYWISKHLSEEEVWKGIRNGLDAVIINPPIILGPGFWKKGSSALFTTAAHGMWFYTDGIKSYVDVNDVARVMILLMNSTITRERFLVTSENLSNKEFFTLVARNVGSASPFIKIPVTISPFVHAFAAIAQFIARGKFPLTNDIIRVIWTKVGYDNSKIRTYTGFNFKPVEKTIKEMAKIYLEEKKSR